jgi:hypothetical protein
VFGFLRVVNGSRRLRRGFKLVEQRRLPEARDAFTAVLEALGPKPKGPSASAWHTTRLSALTSLSTVAATMSEVELARSAIRDGLEAWTEGQLVKTGRGMEFFVEWEQWLKD